MKPPRLYLPTTLAAGALVALDANAFNHAVRVLRLRVGDALTLFDGHGGEYVAELVAVERRAATARVLAARAREAESPLRVVLAQGVSKGERMDYTLQKAVELGVAAVQPLLAERSVVQLDGERLARRVEHWQGVLVAACEQSGRNRVPPLAAPARLGDWLAAGGGEGLRLLLDPQAGTGLRALPAPGGAVTLLIGPEGGLGDGEIAAATAAGWQGVHLGPRVMRTETAGVAALAALQALWGDLG